MKHQKSVRKTRVSTLIILILLAFSTYSTSQLSESIRLVENPGLTFNISFEELTKDGGAVVGGFYRWDFLGNASKYDSYIFKQDDVGQIEWAIRSRFGEALDGVPYTFTITDLEEIEDGDFLIAGMFSIVTAPFTIISTYLIARINNYGELVWAKKLNEFEYPGSVGGGAQLVQADEGAFTLLIYDWTISTQEPVIASGTIDGDILKMRKLDMGGGSTQFDNRNVDLLPGNYLTLQYKNINNNYPGFLDHGYLLLQDFLNEDSLDIKLINSSYGSYSIGLAVATGYQNSIYSTGITGSSIPDAPRSIIRYQLDSTLALQNAILDSIPDQYSRLTIRRIKNLNDERLIAYLNRGYNPINGGSSAATSKLRFGEITTGPHYDRIWEYDTPGQESIADFYVDDNGILHMSSRSSSYNYLSNEDFNILQVSVPLDSLSSTCLTQQPITLDTLPVTIVRDTVTFPVIDFEFYEPMDFIIEPMNDLDVHMICPASGPQNLQTRLIYTTDSCQGGTDSTTLTLRLCNTGFSPHPTGVPFALYDADPTQENASLLLADTLALSLPPTVCRNLEITLALPASGRVFCAINDDGSTPTPYVPAQTFLTFTDENPDDNVYGIDLNSFPYNLTDSLQLCFGESTQIFGQTVDSSGVYTQTFTSLGGCDSVQTFIVNVADSLFVETSIQDETGSNQNGSIVTQNPAGNYQYQWSTGATTPAIGNLAAGDYQLTLTDLQTDCQRVYDFAVDRTVALEDPRTLPGLALRLDPQPGARGDRGYLSLQSTLPTYLHLELLDAAGRSVRNLGTVRVIGKQTLELNAPEVAGLYFIRVSDGIGVRLLAWVVE